jgi:hypothetical protein
MASSQHTTVTPSPPLLRAHHLLRHVADLGGALMPVGQHMLMQLMHVWHHLRPVCHRRVHVIRHDVDLHRRCRSCDDAVLFSSIIFHHRTRARD